MCRIVFNYFLLTIFLGLFLSGCNPNNDVAMLSSYPKYGHCSIDSPQRDATVSIGNELLISGWAYDENKKTIPGTLTMYFVNEDTNEITIATVKRGEKREDVARVLGNPTLVDSGFSGTIDKNKLPAGKYHLVLLQADQAAGVISCAGDQHKITLQ